MGEVYRARDPKLGRELAVKVLPVVASSDPDRRQRFEQEARSASALNHPNILTIHDISESEGTIYIAMELVEGKASACVLPFFPLFSEPTRPWFPFRNLRSSEGVAFGPGPIVSRLTISLS